MIFSSDLLLALVERLVFAVVVAVELRFVWRLAAPAVVEPLHLAASVQGLFQ